MILGKLLVFFLYSLANYRFVCSVEEPVITRDIYDLIQFSKCNGQTPDNFDCVSGSERYGSRSLCQCKCAGGYVTYRDPSVKHETNVYSPIIGKRGCVWYGIYREGCHYLALTQRIPFKEALFPAPTILDLTASGSITLAKQDPFTDSGCLSVDPFVRIPGKNVWKRVTDITFKLQSSNFEKTEYSLSWKVDSTAKYAYQGLVMKLNFSECGQPGVKCIMTKIAGTYTGDSSCVQRTVNNRCCIFPFVHEGKEYNKCVTTPDMPGGAWCAVSLNTSIESGDHKWREFCTTSSTTPSTKRSSRRPPLIITPQPPIQKTKPSINIPPTQDRKTSSKKATPRRLRTEPHHPKTSRHTNKSFGSRAVRKFTVTVTHTTCKQSSKVLRVLRPTFGARGSGGSGGNVGVIVGIVLGIMVLLGILALLAVYLRRRKSEGRSRTAKSISIENLADSPYASVYGTPRYTRNHLNHGYQQSIELTDDKAAVVRRGYLRNSGSSATGSHLYDMVENGNRPNTSLSSPIYSMPEADYSLIMEQKETKIGNNLPPMLPVVLAGGKNNSSRHLYSVLERDNDPLKHPEPIDNDIVFVEANPLYGTITRHNASRENENKRSFAEVNPLYDTTAGFRRDQPPPLPPRLYDDPMELLAGKTEPVGPGEADV